MASFSLPTRHWRITRYQELHWGSWLHISLASMQFTHSGWAPGPDLMLEDPGALLAKDTGKAEGTPQEPAASSMWRERKICGGKNWMVTEKLQINVWGFSVLCVLVSVYLSSCFILCSIYATSCMWEQTRFAAYYRPIPAQASFSKPVSYSSGAHCSYTPLCSVLLCLVYFIAGYLGAYRDRFLVHLMQQKRTRLRFLLNLTKGISDHWIISNYIMPRTTLNLHLGEQKMSLHRVNSNPQSKTPVLPFDKSLRLKCTFTHEAKYTEFWWNDKRDPLWGFCAFRSGEEQHQPESSGSEKTYIKLNVKLLWGCQSARQGCHLNANACVWGNILIMLVWS